MRRIPRVDDYNRKIKIVFYPKRKEEIVEFKKYFNVSYFSLEGITLFEDINTKIYDQIPDIIVCTDNYKIISNKIENYVHYIPIYEYMHNKKEVSCEIRKKAFHNYIDKVKEQIRMQIDISNTKKEAVLNIVNLLDLKNDYLKDHSIRVMHYSLIIGQKLKLNNEDLENLKYAALLHDIGKLVIPSKIISKPSNYLEHEYNLYKYHTLIGEYLLDFSIFKNIRKTIRLHHERIDGKGYLKKKETDEIPLFSRIICIANTFDRLTTSSFYKKRYSHKEALEILNKYSEKVKRKNQLQPFDYRLVEIFIKELATNVNKFVDMNELLYNSLNSSITVEN